MLNFKGFHDSKEVHKSIAFILEMVFFLLGLFVYSVIMLLLISFIMNSIIYLTFCQIILISLVVAFVGTVGRMLYVIRKRTIKH